jgi:hypothetical protein
MDDLPEPGNEVQPRRDHLAYEVDPQFAGRIEKAPSVEDREGPDVLRPTPAGGQHQPVE